MMGQPKVDRSRQVQSRLFRPDPVEAETRTAIADDHHDPCGVSFQHRTDGISAILLIWVCPSWLISMYTYTQAYQKPIRK